MEILNNNRMIFIKFVNNSYNIDELIKRYPELSIEQIKNNLIEELTKELNKKLSEMRTGL